jgi:hypothetical protein
MEPRKEEKVPKPHVEEKRVKEKPKRFRLVRLEERIAPSHGFTRGRCWW